MKKRNIVGLLAFLPTAFAASTSSAAPIVIDELTSTITIGGSWSLSPSTNAAIVSAVNAAMVSWQGAANQSYGGQQNSSSYGGVSVPMCGGGKNLVGPVISLPGGTIDGSIDAGTSLAGSLDVHDRWEGWDSPYGVTRAYAHPPVESDWAKLELIWALEKARQLDAHTINGHEVTLHPPATPGAEIGGVVKGFLAAAEGVAVGSLNDALADVLARAQRAEVPPSASELFAFTDTAAVAAAVTAFRDLVPTDPRNPETTAYAGSTDARVRNAIVDAVLPFVGASGEFSFLDMSEAALAPVWQSYAPLRKAPLTASVSSSEIGLAFTPGH
jgi:hypothetical protein